MKFRLAIKGLFKLFRVSKKRDRKIVSQILLAIVGIVIFLGIWSYFSDGSFDVHAQKYFAKDNNSGGEYLKFLATIGAGLLAIIALRYNAKRTRALDKQNVIAEKGKIDDRFKNAIEHLGSDSPTIVLGGIYSMHQIARDHEDYRKAVFEILCSYLREKTAGQTLWAEMTDDEKKNFKTPIPIQTCIDLLFKHEEEEKYIYKGLVANLQGIRCPMADFREAHLEGADLRGAHLEGAYLWGTHLEGAYLFKAHLEEAVLYHAHLEDAVLYHAHLNWAKLTEATLRGTNFELADLSRAYLQEADLHGADLTDTVRIQTNFTGVDMTDVIGYTPNETDIF